MTCPACEAAQSDPLHAGLYHATCIGCSARMIAHGPEYWRSARESRITPEYRDKLAAAQGIDLADFHARVKDWAAKLHQARQWAQIRKTNQGEKV